MARFKIQSKDGSAIRYEGKPRYIGTYLKPSYLEFSEIASPTPIAWEVGDYVDYPRTGMRYYLYSLPQASKNARKGSHGRAFTYSNVQLHAATKELEIAPFRDLVPNDNGIHFSTAPDVATFENVYGIARRIQACMDDLYPSRWEIRVAEFSADTDAEVVERITTAKDFALSGGTCLDALSKIYELWQDIGWIHTHEDGVEVITIGYANKRIAENTSEPYIYGKGLGLTAIKKNQTNKDEFATRLYVYGSERNLPSRYYNGLDILNAESVDIRNLMLPLDRWGKTDDLPDARKAYLENAEAVAKFGIIPRTHYFDSEDAGANIYPSVMGMTVGMIRKTLADMGKTEYSPREDIYPDDAERVDKVLSGSTVDDDGVLRPKGESYEQKDFVLFFESETSATIPSGSEDVVGFYPEALLVTGISFTAQGKGEVSLTTSNLEFTVVAKDVKSVIATITLTDAYSIKNRSAQKTIRIPAVQNGDEWSFRLPVMKVQYDREERSVFPVVLILDVEVTPYASGSREAVLKRSSGAIHFGFNTLLDETFSISLKQIGFDIEERAAIGEGKVLSMKTGMCAGRNFEIVKCEYIEDTDSWGLTCARQQDDTLGVLFPNNNGYQIASGDEFVLLEIALPELYIRTAMERLLSEGESLLAKVSRVMSHYEPSIDAKVMVESGRTLREGMFMEITDEDVIDNTTDYILIDTLSIYEDEGAIPTYKVTLRERRKVTYKGTPSATSETSTKSAITSNDADVDLTGYATEQYVDKAEAKMDKRLKEIESWFYKEDDNTLGTRFNLFSEKQVSSGGIGEDGDGSGDGSGTGGGSGMGSISGASDADISDQRDGDIIVWSEASDKWVNRRGMIHHVQTTPAKVWYINHGLGKFPNVKIVDSAKQLCMADVYFVDEDNVRIEFGSAQSGSAYLD